MRTKDSILQEIEEKYDQIEHLKADIRNLELELIALPEGGAQSEEAGGLQELPVAG